MHDEIVETTRIVCRCKHNNRYMKQYIPKNEKNVRHVMSFD